MNLLFIFHFQIIFILGYNTIFSFKTTPQNLNHNNFNNLVEYINYPTFNNLKIFSTTNSTSENPDDDNITHILSDFISKLYFFLIEHSDMQIIIDEVLNNPECNNTLKKIFYKDSSDSNNTMLFDMINNSGKGLTDIGLEEECENNDLYYLFLQVKVDLERYLSGTEYYYLYRFLEQNSFFMGLCLPKQCTNFYTRFFNQKQNTNFFKYLNETIGIKKVTNYSIIEAKKPKTFVIIYYVIISYIVLKILISIFGFLIFKICEEQEIIKGHDEDIDESTSSNAINEQLHTETFIFTRKKQNSLSKRKNYSKLKLFFWKIYKFLSFRSNLKYLMAIKNKYYDDTDIEYISFFRLYLLFWFIFNHNIYALIKIPHKDLNNYNFFRSIWFTIIKYSAFSSECWIMLDGLIVSYKLMSFLKKHGNNLTNSKFDSYSIKIFFKFYIISATKMVLFFFSFFVIHVYLGEFTGMIKDTPILQYFITKINNKRVCQKYPFSVFIPFSIQYCDHKNETLIGFRNCYRFVNILMNEFYCFTFILILFYLAYSFKSKLFDFTISIIFLFNLFLSYLSYGEEIGQNSSKYFTFSYILGETKGFTYTHLFINTYMIGVFTGLVYFYYNDIISSNPISTEEERYIPFGFTFNIMKFFDQSGKFLHKIYFIISIIGQVLISMSYYFYIKLFSQAGEISHNFDIEVNDTIKFFYIYERKIFLFFFVLMILILLLYPKVTSLKHFVQSTLFIPFSRINFACLCILDTCVYLFYSAFNIEIFLNLQNLFLISVGLTVYISTLGTILWMLFELPFRIIYKNIVKKDVKNLRTSLVTSFSH
jgi:hypothetical protein